jgi:choline kinase
MKTIILAAGKSERLRPLTNKIPKCLVKIGNTTILEKTIINCLASNLNDLIIISGHGHDYVKKEVENLRKKYNLKVDVIFNEHFHDMNNCYSLYVGIKELLNDDIVVINSDDVFDRDILNGIYQNKNTSLVIDNVKKLTEESMKVYYQDRITDINKKLEIKKSYGEYIGIAKIQKEHLNLLKNSLKKIVDNNSNLYYEDAFQLMFNQVRFKSHDTNGYKWTEIDTVEDLETAKKLIKNNFK